LAYARAARGELGDIIDVECGELAADALGESPLREELAIGVRRGGEAARHLYAELRQGTDHLAKRGVLAADTLDISHAELLERNDVGVHGSSRWSVGVGRLPQAPAR